LVPKAVSKALVAVFYFKYKYKLKQFSTLTNLFSLSFDRQMYRMLAAKDLLSSTNSFVNLQPKMN